MSCRPRAVVVDSRDAVASMHPRSSAKYTCIAAQCSNAHSAAMHCCTAVLRGHVDTAPARVRVRLTLSRYIFLSLVKSESPRAPLASSDLHGSRGGPSFLGMHICICDNVMPLPNGQRDVDRSANGFRHQPDFVDKLRMLKLKQA